MNLNNMTKNLITRFPDRIITIDSHTEGEPTRLIVGGILSPPGRTMGDKRQFFMENLDHVRCALTREPRGHRGIFAAAVTDPVTPQAAFGLIYMDARRYPYLCGHATIGAVTTLIEAGEIPAGGAPVQVTVDTPSGPMAATATVTGGRVTQVGIRMVPAFVLKTEQPIEVPGLGRITVDLVCAGGFFAMVSAPRIGLALTPENADRIRSLGMAVIAAANDQLSVHHPERPDVRTVDVASFYDPAGHGERRGHNAVVYGEAHMDHSPCGTGTAAKLALLHHRGELAPEETFVNTGPLGTAFQARIARLTRVGNLDAAEVEIGGAAHVTGIHMFVTQATDPLAKGYIL